MKYLILLLFLIGCNDNPVWLKESYGITIFKPHGGEIWSMGESKLICWEGDKDVVIRLFRDGFYLRTISFRTLGEHYAWEVPFGLRVDNNYKINIVSLSDKNKFDFSEDFRIE